MSSIEHDLIVPIELILSLFCASHIQVKLTRVMYF